MLVVVHQVLVENIHLLHNDVKFVLIDNSTSPHAQIPYVTLESNGMVRYSMHNHITFNAIVVSLSLLSQFRSCGFIIHVRRRLLSKKLFSVSLVLQYAHVS